MRAERFLVVQDLQVERVVIDDHGVTVGVSADNGARNEIRFAEQRPETRAHRASVLRAWRDAATMLTYVRTSAGAALIDDAEQFRAACDGAFDE